MCILQQSSPSSRPTRCPGPCTASGAEPNQSKSNQTKPPPVARSDSARCRPFFALTVAPLPCVDLDRAAMKQGPAGQSAVVEPSFSKLLRRVRIDVGEERNRKKGLKQWAQLKIGQGTVHIGRFGLAKKGDEGSMRWCRFIPRVVPDQPPPGTLGLNVGTVDANHLLLPTNLDSRHYHCVLCTVQAVTPFKSCCPVDFRCTPR